MNLSSYQQRAFATAQIDWDDPKKRHIPVLGVIGELGSVAAEVKKFLRDGSAYTKGSSNLAEEFGDLIWYLAALASKNGLDLSELKKGGLQISSSSSELGHIYAMVEPFSELAHFVNEFGVFAPQRAKGKLAARVGSALRATLRAADKEGLALETILKANLRKVSGAFGKDSQKPARCFDRDYADYERLPRHAKIQFLERSRGSGKVEVILRVEGQNIGDRLTDNAKNDDGYRFHDAFHLAYVAVLGWSPVVRATFRCKRKSDSRVDEIQDGARAAIVEEAVAQTIFAYARDHSWLKGLTRLDYGILKFIEGMVSRLEVKKCALHEWQRAIFVGFEAFRELKKHRGGWLILDAETQSLTYSKEGPVRG